MLSRATPRAERATVHRQASVQQADFGQAQRGGGCLEQLHAAVALTAAYSNAATSRGAQLPVRVRSLAANLMLLVAAISFSL